jgi:hypothetical protein
MLSVSSALLETVALHPPLRKRQVIQANGQTLVLGQPLLLPARPQTAAPADKTLLSAAALNVTLEVMARPDAERIVREHDNRARAVATELAQFSCASAKTTIHFFFGAHGGGKLWHAGLLCSAIKALDPNRVCRVLWGASAAPQNLAFASDFVNLGAVVQNRRSLTSFNDALIEACRVAAGTIVIVVMKLETVARRAAILQRLHVEHVDARFVAWMCTTPVADMPEFGLAGRAVHGASEEAMNFKQLRSQAESFVAVTAAELERLVFDRAVDFSAPPIDAWRQVRLERGEAPGVKGFALLLEFLDARDRIVESAALEQLRARGVQCELSERVTDGDLRLTGEPGIIVTAAVKSRVLRRVVHVKSTTHAEGSEGWLASLAAWAFQTQCDLLLTGAADGLLVIKQFLPTSPYLLAGWKVFRVGQFRGMRDFLRSSAHLDVAARVEELRRWWQMPLWGRFVTEPIDNDNLAAVFRTVGARSDSRELRLRYSIAEECQAAAKRANLTLPVNTSGVVSLLASFFYPVHGVMHDPATRSFLSRDASAARSIAVQGIALGDASRGVLVSIAAPGAVTPLFRFQPLSLAAAAGSGSEAQGQHNAAARIRAAMRSAMSATGDATLLASTFVGGLRQTTSVRASDVAAKMAAQPKNASKKRKLEPVVALRQQQKRKADEVTAKAEQQSEEEEED